MENAKELAMEILEKTCGTDEIFEDFDLDLIEAGYIDSFSVINSILDIEKETGVRLQPSDLTKDDIKTVNNFIAFMEKMQK